MWVWMEQRRTVVCLVNCFFLGGGGGGVGISGEEILLQGGNLKSLCLYASYLLEKMVPIARRASSLLKKNCMYVKKLE